MAIPSSAVRWVLDSPQQMTIYRPRDYSDLLFWIGMIAAVVIVFALLAIFVKRGAFWIIPFVLLIGFFVVHLGYSDTATAVASKREGTLRITDYRGVTNTYPLQSVQKIAVETQDGDSRRMVFVLSTGEDVPLGMWAPRKGLYQAADAFNSFLSDNSGTEPASAAPQSEDPDGIQTMQKKYDQQKADYEKRKRQQPSELK